jgi:hypothetical protein
MARIYLVFSNHYRAYWGPNQSGYTEDVWEAGRYTHDEAKVICQARGRRQGDEPPHEVVVLAPEAGRQVFTVSEIRAVPQLMAKRIHEATGLVRTASKQD